MAATALPKVGQLNDRGFYLELKDKPIRTSGASWLEPQGSVVVFEDFTCDVLADSPYVTITQSGTATTAAAISATAGPPTFPGHGGWVAGSVDNVDAEIDEIAIGGLGTGAGTPWMYASRAGKGVVVAEWGFLIPTALTARQYFVGLSDDPVEGTGTNGPLNIQTGVTLVDVAADCAGFIFSSLATGPTVYKMAAAIATTPSTLLTPGVTGVVDCYTVCRVEVDSAGKCYFYQSIASATTGGRPNPAYVGTTDTGVTTTVGLLPYFSAAATTTTAVEWEVDYAFGACAR